MIKTKLSTDGPEDSAVLPSILELQYENVLSGATRAFMDENCRLSNVSRLLHEHDKEILIADLEKMKIKLPDLEVRLVQAAQELQRAQAGIVQLYGILRARSREVNQLKIQNKSLEAIVARVTKSKVEKSASMRQLSKTRFDASQLRLQSNLLQSVTPEKLASQQPVSLEVDPQSQIRLVGDPKPGSNKMPTVADFFSDSQNQRGLVQGDTRFELNQKLKSERDLRISLEKEPSKLKDELTVTKKRPRDSPGGPNPRFPDTSEMSQNDPKILRDFERLPSLQAFRSQLTIATPGGVKASHKPKPMLAVPGDVSSFSVTPFLKRATMEFNDSDMSSSETQTSVHSKDHVLPTDACSSTLVPALTVPKIDKAFNHRGQDNWSNHPATNRHCRTGSRIHASAKTSKESVFKKQRELISKRERGGFDSGEDADNHVRAAKNESSDGLWTRTDSLSFSPLKRRIRVL